MKNFISVEDVDDVDALVHLAIKIKQDPFSNKGIGRNKKIGLLFLNPSLRTRISTQVAAQNLGMEAIVFNVDKDGWALEYAEGAVMNGATVEHIKDAAPVLGSYFNVLCIRTFPSLKDKEADYSETIIKHFIKNAGVPVVSLESSTLHPLQSLTDVITITENMSAKNIKRPKIVLSWAPHIKSLPQCVANSFSQWIRAWGNSDFVITHPHGYDLDKKFTGGATVTNNQDEALRDADFVYVKNWSSYNDYGAMPGSHDSWMLTEQRMQQTNNGMIMHCLPVRRNVELSDELLDGPRSLVTQQGANRVWAAQAVITEILSASNLAV